MENNGDNYREARAFLREHADGMVVEQIDVDSPTDEVGLHAATLTFTLVALHGSKPSVRLTIRPTGACLHFEVEPVAPPEPESDQPEESEAGEARA